MLRLDCGEGQEIKHFKKEHQNLLNSMKDASSNCFQMGL